MSGLRLILAGLGAVAAGILISFNPDLGGPIRGGLAIVFGVAIAIFGVRMLSRAPQTGPDPAHAADLAESESQ